MKYVILFLVTIFSYTVDAQVSNFNSIKEQNSESDTLDLLPLKYLQEQLNMIII